MNKISKSDINNFPTILKNGKEFIEVDGEFVSKKGFLEILNLIGILDEE